MNRSSLYLGIAIAIFCGLILPSPAFAYIGPGTGLTALGSLLALLAAIVLAIFGFVWFPIKRLVRRMKRKDTTPSESDE